MNRIGFVLTLALASPALAAADWGKAADPKVCNEAFTAGQIHYNQACQAAIDKLVDEGCIKDPEMEKALAGAGYVNGQNVSKFSRDKGKKVPQDARDICEKEALERIHKQAEAGDVEKAELPKATGKNAALEKMITTAFKHDWTGGEKLLKVIFTDKTDWTVDRNGLGIIISRSIYAAAVYKKEDKCTVHSTYWVQKANGKGFSGPLEEHGAGAETNVEILCTKVK